MDISKYIYDYLMEGNTSVVVPELGCFTIVAKPSVIQNNIVFPPVKTIEFDCENTEDNHIFTRYIAERENITIEQAALEVYIFYDHFFKRKLVSNGRPIIFENFGMFSLTDARDIQFEPVAEFFKDNYGLGQVPISGDATEPPPFVAAPVTMEPFVPPPAPEPIKPVESEPVQPPSKPEQVKPKDTSPEPDSALFDTDDNVRYRENTARRRPAAEVPPAPPPKPAPPKASPPKPSKPPKPPKEKKTGNSNLWLLWVFFIAAGLCAAGYYFYPEINKFLANNKFFSKEKPVTMIAEPEPEPEYTPDEPDENTLNPEVAQTLDEATDKKNALNPADHQQTEAATSQTSSSQRSVSSTPVAQASVASSQISVGSGKWVLIAGSFRVQSNAEAFQRTLQAEGFSCEIILSKNQLYWVSVASYDTLAEATRQAEQMKSRRDVWVARR